MKQEGKKPQSNIKILKFLDKLDLDSVFNCKVYYFRSIRQK